MATRFDLINNEVVVDDSLVPKPGANIFAVPPAAVDFNFSLGTLTDQVSGNNLITFTRASSGWYWNGSQFVEAGVNEPRFAVDPATGQRGLLVEEQRTNLLLNSDTLSTQNVTVAATAYTLSFYGTGTVTLSGASTAGPLVGTGAAPQRVSLTFTPSAGTLTLTVAGDVRYAQLEAGSIPTSPIITTGTAATRSADVASVTGANFSGWYNQAGGTIYSEKVGPSIGGNQFAASIADGTVNNEILQFWNNVHNASINAGGVSQGNSFSGTTNSSLNKGAYAFATNDIQGAGNGELGAADTLATLPAVNQLTIGRRVNSTFLANTVIPRLTYWPQRLPNATLQALTT